MIKPLKVLHTYKVYQSDLEGGVPSVISVLSRESRRCVDNQVLVARVLGRFRRETIKGTPVEAVGSLGTIFSTPIAPTYYFALRRRARNFDIVLHHAPFPLADAYLARLPKHVRLIIFWHADPASYSRLQRLVGPAMTRSLRRADQIIVADRSMITNSRFLQPFSAKCAVIPYGIDVDYWSACTPQEMERAKRLRTRFPRLIVALGRLVPYKGFEVLVRAMKHVDGSLVLIGEGKQRDRLNRLATELGVWDRIKFAGAIPDAEVKSYLHAARVFAFPSVTRAEAFGLVQLQAMAAGLPIVNTALNSAVPHVARNDREALTVEPNDENVLANALNRLLNDPSLALRLGQSGKLRAKHLYDQDTFIKRIRAIYSDLTADRERPCPPEDET